ncbi:MAG: aminopeptidase P family protein [Thermodesulfobacteriota bacterium]|nr:aminopeptidase P family protein [Thermodesulfobacteriota bacterium]
MNSWNIDAILEDRHIDALLVTLPENVRYLSGFTGSSGALLIGSDLRLFLTDSRYTEQAGREILDTFEVMEIKRFVNDIPSIIVKRGLKSLGFESDHLSYSTYSSLKAALSEVQFSALKDELNKLRMQKSADELEKIKHAIKIATDSLKAVIGFIKDGVCERDIAVELEYGMRKRGAERISFDIIVASGERSSMAHGIATEKKIKQGEFITIDFGCYSMGYCSDETVTFVLGNASSEQKRIYNIVKDAHDMGIENIKAGMEAKVLDKIVRDYIKTQGYGNHFGHGTGHGVGLAVHERPTIGPESDDILCDGMVFTIEPGIYIPHFGGVRIEDMVVVNGDNVDVLTYCEKEFIAL